MHNYDLIVVGGGKAGKSLAMDRAKKGWSVALIEEKFVGGTCINVACIPTKTLVTSARRFAQTRSNDSFGIVGTDNATVDLTKLRGHKETIVNAMIGAHRKMFSAPGIDFIEGTARFVGERTVEVITLEGETRTLQAPRVLVNLGTRPAHPAIPGLWEAGAWDSEDILRLEELPSSLVVIGAGYIGVEFAQMMSQFGVKVTLVSSGEHILPREDADIAHTLQEVLESDGVTILHGVSATEGHRVGTDVESGIEVVLSDGSSVTAERVLVAAGRTPNTDKVNIEAAGIELDERGFIRVDEHLRTSADSVWAAGDVAGTPMFTHASWNDFRIIREQLDGVSLDDPRTSTSGRIIPWSVFATPELGRIGVSEEEARAAGLDVLVASVPVASIPRAKTMFDTQGLWKAVVDAQTHKILGASLLSVDAGEVITAVQMAMSADLTYEQVRMLPIAHPTMGEGLNILFDQLP